MNKKYNLSLLLVVFLANNIECSSFQKAQNQLITYALNTALFSGAMYLGGKVIAKYEENSLPDAPPHFQECARKILAENGLKNADSIPLKMGDGWSVQGGSFIQVDSKEVNALENIFAGRSTYSDEKQRIIRAFTEYSLLHEKEHYHNGDFGKRCLLAGATIAFGFQVMTGKSLTDDLLSSPTSLLVGGGSGFIVVVPYRRYCEKEADRSAFMNISSLEKLEITKHIMEAHAQDFETNLLTKSLSDQPNWFERKMRPMIAHRWHTLNRDIATASFEEQAEIRQKQRNLMEAASFMRDQQHPSYRSMTELAQECIDLRKAKHKESFKSTVSAVLRAQDIKQ